jgi:hypothetical protein
MKLEGEGKDVGGVPNTSPDDSIEGVITQSLTQHLMSPCPIGYDARLLSHFGEERGSSPLGASHFSCTDDLTAVQDCVR